LIHKDPELLDTLQDDAKDNADFRKYITIFVSSEGNVAQRTECMYWHSFLVLLKDYYLLIVILILASSAFSHAKNL